MNTTTPTTTTAVAVPASTELDRDTRQLYSHAARIASSGLVPVDIRGKTDSIILIALRGRDLGLELATALEHLHPIKGRLCMSAELARALARRAGHDMWEEESSATKVTIAGTLAGDPADRVRRCTFTIDDAKTAQLVGGNDNYRKYPNQMLFARASKTWIRRNCPEVLMGIRVDTGIDAAAEREPDRRLRSIDNLTEIHVEPEPSADVDEIIVDPDDASDDASVDATVEPVDWPAYWSEWCKTRHVTRDQSEALIGRITSGAGNTSTHVAPQYRQALLRLTQQWEQVRDIDWPDDVDGIRQWLDTTKAAAA